MNILNLIIEIYKNLGHSFDVNKLRDMLYTPMYINDIMLPSFANLMGKIHDEVGDWKLLTSNGNIAYDPYDSIYVHFEMKGNATTFVDTLTPYAEELANYIAKIIEKEMDSPEPIRYKYRNGDLTFYIHDERLTQLYRKLYKKFRQQILDMTPLTNNDKVWRIAQQRAIDGL